MLYDIRQKQKWSIQDKVVEKMRGQVYCQNKTHAHRAFLLIRSHSADSTLPNSQCKGLVKRYNIQKKNEINHSEIQLTLTQIT